MTAAVVIAAIFVGLIVHESLYRRHQRRMEAQLWENFDYEGLWAELNASRDRAERAPDDRGEA